VNIASTASILDGVTLEPPFAVAEFCIVGETTRSESPAPTRIGANALLRSHTVVYAGNHIGKNFQTGHCVLVREENEIGDDVSIGSHSIVEHHVIIGNRVRLHSNVFVPEHCVLEDDAWLGPNVCLTNADHPRCPNIPRCLRGVVIRRGAKVGANATILPGVEIGEGALVGAGSVVVENVPAFTVVAGNPARVLRGVEELVCPLDQTTHPYGQRRSL